MLLKLGKTADNERVFKVASNTRFEKSHVIAGELSHALLQKAADAAVAWLSTVLKLIGSVTYNHVLDISVAVLQIVNHFFKVFQQQIFVVQNFLA